MEALERLRFESFVRNNPEVLTLFGEFVNSMVDAFPDDEFMEYYHSPQIVNQYTQYLAYVEEKMRTTIRFSFGLPLSKWSSYYCYLRVVQEQTTGTCICQQSDQCYLGFSPTTVSMINATLQHIGLK